MATSKAETQSNGSSTNNNLTKVNLWCVPRAVSTSFLKCMTYVPDSQVWLEPYQSIRLFSKCGQHRDTMLKLLVGNWECETQGEFGAHIKGKAYEF